MKYKIILEVIVISIISYLLLLIPFIDKTMDAFLPVVNNYLYLFIFLLFIYMMSKNIIADDKQSWMILNISYIMLLLLTLYFRKKYDDYMYKDGFYLGEWLKYFLKNKTVFINILGNFLLFMPLGYILTKATKKRILVNIFIGIGIIICLEIIQFITKRGVLDIADIFLNSLGLFISIIISKERGNKKYVRG